MATEQDRQDERDRLGTDPMQAPPAAQLENENVAETPGDQDIPKDSWPEESSPGPDHKDLSDDDPTSDDTGEGGSGGKSAAEQAVENQDRALETGEELPG